MLFAVPNYGIEFVWLFKCFLPQKFIIRIQMLNIHSVWAHRRTHWIVLIFRYCTSFWVFNSLMIFSKFVTHFDHEPSFTLLMEGQFEIIFSHLFLVFTATSCTVQSNIKLYFSLKWFRWFIRVHVGRIIDFYLVWKERELKLYCLTAGGWWCNVFLIFRRR